jgi:3'-phosphoadenosine 5'-phosphosulfate sulfotransferase (PAPS reductase)/FAD synthetase
MALAISERGGLDAINEYLADKAPEQIVGWAADNFAPDKIYSLTSAGLSAPLTLDLLHRTARDGISPRIPIIHNDTGLLPDQVHEYLHEKLAPAFGFEPIVSRPDLDTVKEIEKTELWKHDKELYRQLTKHDPLGKTIRQLGAQVLITGVRHDQTQNRQELDILTYGADGEYRLNPNYWTPTQAVEDNLEKLIAEKRVPRHPLHLVVDFVDDWPFIGGAKEECGINSAARLAVAPAFTAQESA